VHESVTETNTAVVEEDPVVSEAEVLLAIVGAEYRLAALALTMSSIAYVKSSAWEDIINARWWNVGGFFGAIVEICRNRQAEHRQRVWARTMQYAKERNARVTKFEIKKAWSEKPKNIKTPCTKSYLFSVNIAPLPGFHLDASSL
jgi:hypothetical protein